MRVLLIAYSFPPFHDAQSLRWYYLVNALSELDIKIDVITIKHPFEGGGSWKFHKNVYIFRLFPGPIEYFSLKAKKKLEVEGAGNVNLRKTARFKLMKSLYWGLRKSAGNILPGDIRTEWFFFAAKFLRRNIRLENYSCMITSHEPWVDSLLGLYLKKTNSNFRWIADFGDPYVAPYMPKHKLWYENFLEKSIYKNADTLLFTNENIMDHLKKKYPFLQDKKILILEQGFSYSSCIKNMGMKRRNNIFTLAYTGTLYRDFRDPSNLIKALSMVDFEFKLLLAGKNEAFVKDFAFLGNRFEFLGFIDHFAALKLQRNSDVLIHIGNKSAIQIPGKIYEYMGALRPILCINYDNEDRIGKLVKELKCGIPCSNDPLAIKHAVETFYSTWQNNDNTSTITCKDIYCYSWENKARI